MDDSIEAVDYIFDRYGYLKLDENSSLEEIRQTIRKKRSENHPDKLVHVSDEIKELAKNTIGLIDKCERVLLNPEVKPLYDAKLAQFKKEETHLVSVDGRAIIDVGRIKVNLHYLLNEPIQDMKDLEHRAMQMTGYSQKKLDKVKSRYEEDWDSRMDLREELTKKLVYFNVMEEFYWQQAGINGGTQKGEYFKAQSVEDMEKIFTEKVADIKTHAIHSVQERNGASLLGFTAPMLLGSNLEAIDHNAIAIKAHEQFEFRAQELKLMVLERAKTIEELTLVSKTKHIKVSDSSIHDILLMPSQDEWPHEFEVLGSFFRFDCSNTSMTAMKLDKTLWTLEDTAQYEYNLHILEPNEEIGAPLIEVMALAEQVLKDFQ